MQFLYRFIIVTLFLSPAAAWCDEGDKVVMYGGDV